MRGLTDDEPSAPSAVAIDSSVLFNFLRIDRLDLLAAHADSFVVPSDVAAEITAREQRDRYAAAVADGHLVQRRVASSDEAKLFMSLRGDRHLGRGECASIAIAFCRGFRVAVEDQRAIKRARRAAGSLLGSTSVIRTQDVIVELIKSHALTIAEADRILLDWASNHRFRLKISSFKDLL